MLQEIKKYKLMNLYTERGHKVAFWDAKDILNLYLMVITRRPQTNSYWVHRTLLSVLRCLGGCTPERRLELECPAAGHVQGS